MDGFSIRTMEREDLDFAVRLAADEGWNPGLSDADMFYRADPEGFFIGELDGRPVGCISGVAYPDDFGFVGLYIMTPEHRGRGFGLKLWDHAMEYLGDVNIGLDGVPAQQENYKKSGFRLAYRNVRCEGEGGGECPDSLTPLNEISVKSVTAYDRCCFPSARRGFLESWIGQAGSFGYALQRNGDLAGWGVMRRCREGWKIGPLFADDESAAEDLFTGLSSHAPKEKIYLDVPEPHKQAAALAERHAMAPVFETARMYTGPDPDIDFHRMYGVTTFELG